MSLKKIDSQIESFWKAEFSLRRCGELLALKKNLIDAAEYLYKLNPQNKFDLLQSRDELLSELKEKFFDKIQYETESCNSTEVLKYQVIPHKQQNPTVPKLWPNWYFHFSPSN